MKCDLFCSGGVGVQSIHQTAPLHCAKMERFMGTEGLAFCCAMLLSRHNGDRLASCVRGF